MAEEKGAFPPVLKVAHLMYYESDKAGAQKTLDSLKAKSDEEKRWLKLIRGDWLLEDGDRDAALARYEAAEPLLKAGEPLIVERLEEVVRHHQGAPALRMKLAKMCE
jgi:hypothetical protein